MGSKVERLMSWVELELSDFSYTTIMLVLFIYAIKTKTIQLNFAMILNFNHFN
jgi:hypothetical protein